MRTTFVQFLGERLFDNATCIAENAINLRAEKDERYKANLTSNRSETVHFLAEFFQLMAESLNSQEDSRVNITAWGKEVGELAIRHSQKLDDALASAAYQRLALWSFIEEQAIVEGYSATDILVIAKSIDPMLDYAIYGFSQSYVKSHETAYTRFKWSLQEWSIPLVPLFEGIAIIPLIGDIDTNRAQLLMEKTSQRATELQLSKIILDLSGVSLVDTMVAHHIFQLVDVLGLLGVKVMITGISPAIAQTCVDLNIQLEKLETASSLQLALKTMGYGSKNF
ncbi:STAS domain-containing protein [Planococcus dechangensis]|uniref:STAS domain-containing protein n=1 Tax=Planococcus dechangensis TaxID=1176255 RepID=A0ABV9M8F5_9BACL